MLVEFSESAVQDLVQRVQTARAGDLSVYGLLNLVDALEPYAAQLERARKRREDGGQLPPDLQAVLGAEEVLGRAPTEMKRVLAEELKRGLRPGGLGVTARERARALGFLEKQLKAAALDTSAAGEGRRAQLREFRAELEACQAAPDSEQVRKLERQLTAAKTEFRGVADTYQAWEAGKVKFKSTDELNSTKRKYGTLQRQVASAEQELEEALSQRRTAPAKAWTEPTPTPVPPKAKAAAKGGGGGGGYPAAPAASVVPSKASPPTPTPTVRQVPPATSGPPGLLPPGEGGGSSGSRRPEAPAVPISASAMLTGGFDEAEEDEDRARRPARMAARPKADSSQKEEAKRRGREILQELSAELSRERAAANQALEREARSQAKAPRGGAPASAGPAVTASAYSVLEVANEDLDEADSDSGQQPLPPDWESVWSEEHGKAYYWNKVTNVVQWDPPRAPPAPKKPQPSVANVAAAAPAAAAAASRKTAGPGSQTGIGGLWVKEDPEEHLPKLSFTCVCTAVAELRGIKEDQVRKLGCSTVEEFRQVCDPEEWAHVRTRAVAIEAENRERAKREEKERQARKLAKITASVAEGAAKGQGPSAPGPATAKAAAASRSNGAATQSGATRPQAKAAGGTASKKGGSTGGTKGPPTATLSTLAHENRFAKFQVADDSD